MPYGHPFDPPETGPMFDDMYVPGRDLPQRRGEDRSGLSPWGRFAKGGAVGHTTNLVYSAAALGAQEAPNDMIMLAGDDLDACQVVITLGTPRAVPQEVALIEGNIQNATGEGSNFGFGDANFPGTLEPIAWPPIDAIVEFGTGGAKHLALVDFINGVQFSVTASWLRVKAAISQPQSNGFKGTSAVYTLAATAAPGWTRGNATKTIYVGTVDESAESAVYAIPPFARRATVYLCDPGVVPNVTAAYLRFWQSPDGVAGGNNVGNAFVSGNTPGPFVVPAAAGYFSVYNQAGIGALTTVVFELALG